MSVTVPKDYRVKPGTWGESKVRVQIMLTPTALLKVDECADELHLTRAELLERVIRGGGLEAAENYKEVEPA